MHMHLEVFLSPILTHSYTNFLFPLTFGGRRPGVVLEVVAEAPVADAGLAPAAHVLADLLGRHGVDVALVVGVAAARRVLPPVHWKRRRRNHSALFMVVIPD